MRLGEITGLDKLPMQPDAFYINLANKLSAYTPVILPVSDNPLGLEIEAEGYNPELMLRSAHSASFGKYFAMKDDGSLRDNGIEFVSSILKPQYMGMALSLLENINKDLKLKYNDRTGIHVHVNVRDLHPDNYRTLIAGYTLFENCLFQISGNRKHSIFCLPVRESVNGLWIPFQPQCDEHFGENDWVVHHSSNAFAKKYMAFNYLPIRSFGTVEFRHMHGTANIKEIAFWISVIIRLHNFAANTQYKDIKDVIFALNSNSQYENFARIVFKEDYDAFMEQCHVMLVKDMEEGVGVLKEWSVNRDILLPQIEDVPKKQAVLKPKLPGDWAEIKGADNAAFGYNAEVNIQAAENIQFRIRPADRFEVPPAPVPQVWDDIPPPRQLAHPAKKLYQMPHLDWNVPPLLQFTIQPLADRVALSGELKKFCEKYLFGRITEEIVTRCWLTVMKQKEKRAQVEALRNVGRPENNF